MQVADGTLASAHRLNKAPDLADKVMNGEIKSATAMRQIKERKAAEPEKLKLEPDGKNTITLFTHDRQQVIYPLPRGKAAFNSTNEFVSWAGWTWNPVTRCLHGCPFCYARALAASRDYARSYPVGFTPLFHSERLEAPANTPVPAATKDNPALGRVFVCSMADLYGRWVPNEWIARVHQSCRKNPQWEYLMLTKFPQRYVERDDLPPTAWLGTSVDEQKRVRIAEEAFRQIKRVRVRWLSLEPLKFTDLSMFDWIVIGSQRLTVQPDGVGVVKAFARPFEWVARLVMQAREAGCKIWLKPNLIGAVSDTQPGMQLPQESPL